MAWKTSNPTKANIRKRLYAAQEALESALELMTKNGMSGARDATDAATQSLVRAIAFHEAGR